MAFFGGKATAEKPNDNIAVDTETSAPAVPGETSEPVDVVNNPAENFKFDESDPSQMILKKLYENGYGEIGNIDWTDLPEVSSPTAESYPDLYPHFVRSTKDDSGNEITFFSDPGGETAKDKMIEQIRNDLTVDINEREGVYPIGEDYDEFHEADARLIVEALNKHVFDSYASEQGNWLGGGAGAAAQDAYEAFTGKEALDLFEYDEETDGVKDFFRSLEGVTLTKYSDPNLQNDQLTLGRQDTTNPGSSSLDNPHVLNIEFTVGNSGTIMPRNVHYDLVDNGDGTATIQITDIRESTHVEDRENPTGTGHHTEEDEIYPQY